ncbi:MAG: hypothetical protein ACK5O2_09435 [Microthrixaceae bacterium]
MSRDRGRARSLSAAIGLLFGVAALLVAGVASPVDAVEGPSGSKTWDAQGGDTVSDTWRVPTGVTSVRVEALGARVGGQFDGQGVPHDYALGGLAAGTISVTPGENLQVNVASDGAGVRISWGGGASDVRRGGTDLADRVVVGGGAGGTGDSDVAGGNGGGTAGPSSGAAGGGQPGTATSGGAGGSGTTPGNPGTFGLGGERVVSSWEPRIGSGGGGDGWYGGGSGGCVDVGGDSCGMMGGGGGGSSYVIPSATDVVYGNPGGAPYVKITWGGGQPQSADCPDPAPAFRVYANRPSLLLARFLIDSCGYSVRELVVGDENVTVLDPPSSSMCPMWNPFKVYMNRSSLLLARFLLDTCAYQEHWQDDEGVPTPYIVPAGWPSGARVK